MKLTSLLARMNLAKTALTILAPVLFSQAASGTITVHFVEEGDDVRVSFSGTLDLSGAPGTVSSDTDAGGSSVSSVGIVAGGPRAFIQPLGFLPQVPNNFSFTDGAAVADAFGFSNGLLVWSNRHVSQGTPGGIVTELTVDPELDNFVLLGETLESLSAENDDIVEGTVLWTSNGTAGDTFVFSRLTPGGEPEPEPEPEPQPIGTPVLCGLRRPAGN